MSLLSSLMKPGLVGAGVVGGGVAGYMSSDVASSKHSGAVLGAGAGMMGGLAFATGAYKNIGKGLGAMFGKTTGISQFMKAAPGSRMSAMAGSPLMRTLNATKGVGKTVGKGLAMANRHPSSALALGIMGATGVWAYNRSGGINDRAFDPGDRTQMQLPRSSATNQRFQNSASGNLSFGLHNRRHG